MLEKSDGRKISRETLAQYRFRAVELRKAKWEVQEIANSFGVNRVTVSKWLATYRKEGKNGLRRKKAKGASPKLTVLHKKKILRWLKQPATDFGFETPLWTCQRVSQLIKKKLGIDLHVSNVWVWLRKWGLTNQKPERRALESNPEKVKTWLREEWPRIQAHARRWQAMLYFQDEAGVSLTAVMGKTWAPKGERPVVRVTGNRGGFCVSSAISPAGRMIFRIEREKVTAKVFVGFLKQVLKQHKNRKVIIISDQARPHVAKLVKRFAKSKKKRFAIYYLPAYSPELNPDERVWSHLKNHKLKAHQAQTKTEFEELVLSKMRSMQRTPSLIKSFFYGLYVA